MDNKILYIAIVVVVALIAILFFVGSQPATPASTASSSAQTTTGSGYNSTTTALPTNSTVMAGAQGCTATPYYTCNNIVFNYNKNGSSVITATITQKTGQAWSSFGVGYAPEGTSMSEGIPNIEFYNSNASAQNYGNQVNNGTATNIIMKLNATGSTTTGTIWGCYVNSGIVYVGNGCTTQGGVPTYVVIATVNLTAS